MAELVTLPERGMAEITPEGATGIGRFVFGAMELQKIADSDPGPTATFTPRDWGDEQSALPQAA